MNGRCVGFGVLAAAFAAVVVLADPFFLLVLGLVPLVWIGLPAAALAVILLLVALRTGRSLRPALTLLAAVAVFGALIGLALPANRLMQQRAVDDAKAYPARVAPLLEAYRQMHGTYPGSLDQLPGKPPVPRLLRTPYGYRSDGCGYSFSFGQPGGFINTWDYRSEMGSWLLST